MDKFSRDLDENLVQKVEMLAKRHQLNNITAIRCNKLTSEPCFIVRGNDLVRLFTGKDIIAIAIYQEAFDLVGDETQNIWIENLLSRIEYDGELDKFQIQKPEIEFTEGMYNVYKDDLIASLVQAKEICKSLKEAEKEKQKEKQKEYHKKYNERKKARKAAAAEDDLI